jgi:hypothetical protein
MQELITTYLIEKGRRLGESAVHIWMELDVCLVQEISQTEQLLFRRLLVLAAANFSRCSFSRTEEHL